LFKEIFSQALKFLAKFLDLTFGEWIRFGNNHGRILLRRGGGVVAEGELPETIGNKQ